MYEYIWIYIYITAVWTVIYLYFCSNTYVLSKFMCGFRPGCKVLIKQFPDTVTIGKANYKELCMCHGCSCVRMGVSVSLYAYERRWEGWYATFSILAFCKDLSLMHVCTNACDNISGCNQMMMTMMINDDYDNDELELIRYFWFCYQIQFAIKPSLFWTIDNERTNKWKNERVTRRRRKSEEAGRYTANDQLQLSSLHFKSVAD